MRASALKIWKAIKLFFSNYGLIMTVIVAGGYLLTPRLYEGIDKILVRHDQAQIKLYDAKLDSQLIKFTTIVDSLANNIQTPTIKLDDASYTKLLGDFRTIQGELVATLPLFVEKIMDDKIEQLLLTPVEVIDRNYNFLYYEYYLRVPAHEGVPEKWVKLQSPSKLK